jgi:hypothetical protein
MSEVTYKHPSYCLVSFSRRQGNPKLFGSALTNHYSYVTLQVKRTSLIRDEHDDHYFGTLNGDIIEVDMSAAQFAELLTTMNVGLGTPGTLRRLNNVSIEEPPDLPSEVEHIQMTFDKDLRSFAKTVLEKSLPQARKILEKPSLSKADRAELLDILESVSRRLTDAVPFILEMFNESVGKRVTAAKTEIDSLLGVILRKTGLKALQLQASESPPAELPSKYK